MSIWNIDMLKLYCNYVICCFLLSVWYFTLSVPIEFPIILMAIFRVILIIRIGCLMSFYSCFYRVLFKIYLKVETIGYVVLLSFLEGVIFGYVYDKFMIRK